jgi:hypothetical protein
LAGAQHPDRVPCQESSAARPDCESLAGQRLRVNSFTAYNLIVKPGPAVVNKTRENQRSERATPIRHFRKNAKAAAFSTLDKRQGLAGRFKFTQFA